MFTFNFNNTNVNLIEKENTQIELESKEVFPNDIISDITSCNDEKIQILEINNVKLKYISSTQVLNILKETKNDNYILEAEANHSDLQTGKYEGGLKIWECTYDLISFFCNEEINFSDKKVLDLGCGAGLLGIYALLHNSFVDFQDYNSEVIEFMTIPNVCINNENTLNNCKFYSGDWKSFLNLNKSKKYDIILTSETIYNSDNFEKLFNIFNYLLEDNGIIFLAAKIYYFGVGGGLRQFEKILNDSGSFKCETCWRNFEGVQREIIKITKIT